MQNSNGHSPVVRLARLRKYLESFPEHAVVVLGREDIGRNGDGPYVSLEVAMDHLDEEANLDAANGSRR